VWKIQEVEILLSNTNTQGRRMQKSVYGLEVKQALLKVHSLLPFSQRESVLRVYKDDVSPENLLMSSDVRQGMKVCVRERKEKEEKEE